LIAASAAYGAALDEKYITWRIPTFTGFNNQIVIHIELMQVAEKTGRKLVSPGFMFQPSPGYQSLESLFTVTDDLKKHFVVGMNDQIASLPARSVTMEELFSATDQIVNIADDGDLWAYVYKRWLLKMHSSPATLYKYLDLLQINKDTHIARTVADIASKHKLGTEFIGVHLRGQEWKERCEGVLKWDPRRRFYGCYQERYELVPVRTLFVPFLRFSLFPPRLSILLRSSFFGAFISFLVHP
jgi:hypothetical protein